MYKYVFGTIFSLSMLVSPTFTHATGLTTAQSTSLIAVVQSSPGTPASAFVNLITAFSNITVTQATSLIAVVQASPSTPATAFVDLLTSFTADIPATQPATPATNQALAQTESTTNQSTNNTVSNTTSTQSTPQIVKDLVLRAVTDLPVPFSGFHQARIEAKYTENGKEVAVSKSYSLSNGESKTFTGDLFDITPKSLADITVTVTAGGLTKTINIPVITYVKVDPSVTSVDKNITLSSGEFLQIGEFTIKDGDLSPMFLNQIKGTTNAPQGTEYRITCFSSAQMTDDSQKTQSNNAVVFTGLSCSSAMSTGFQGKKNISVRINVNSSSVPVGNYSLTITSFTAWDSAGNYRDVQGLPIVFHYTVQ